MLGLLLLATSISSFAGGYIELPRSLGDLEMGMSEKTFTKLTSVHPATCAICIDRETFATLSRGQLYKINAEGDGADIFFYEDKLYLISIGSLVKDLFTAKEYLESEFGGPGQKLGTFNDVSKLKWEDSNSVITLNYHAKTKTVFSINYYDWELKQERDWRESQAQEAAAKPPSALADIN